MKKGKVIIEVVNGVEGPSLYIGDEDSGHRLAGPKPWGGGGVVFKFIVDAAELQEEVTRFGNAPQRTWVGLTHSDIDQGLLRSDYALKTAEAWRAGVVFAMTKLKEKNT